MYLVLDCENSVQWLDDGRVDNSPYNPLNELVSVGYKGFTTTGDTLLEQYDFFNHNDGVKETNQKARLQATLDKTTLLIAHNLKYDLQWLWAAGFKYEGMCYDTMHGDYLLARGIHTELSLKALAEKHKLAAKKSELIEEYWDRKIGFEAMPQSVVEEYGRADVQTCFELYNKQCELFSHENNKGLIPTLQMMNELLPVLAEIEKNGVRINLNALASVEKDYIEERRKLEAEIRQVIAETMGDTPINIASPEQLSWFIYSRKVKDKKEWINYFNIKTDERNKPLRRPRFSPKELKDAINAKTDVLYRTTANQCPVCRGRGRVPKFKKDGTTYKNDPKCQECDARGVIYTNTTAVAGLKLGPRNVKDLSANGFSTDKEILEYLSSLPNVSTKAKAVLKALIRISAIDTYLSSFVGGIRRNVRANLLLHTSLNQCVTSTGRLSSSNPNMQNMPRGQTFPVKRAFRSRWKGGLILEADGMQLEFRTAAGLSECPVMLSEIWAGVDVHAFTSKVLTEAGQPTTRQEAKPRTFRPLYGGKSGTPAEIAYNQAFMAKYTGLQEWHDRLLEAAIKVHVIHSPSGREYSFPYAKRTWSGYIQGETQIKNFPVQGFATADVIPLCVIRVAKLLKKHKAKSLLVNTVHDSVVVDVYPGELDLVTNIVIEAFIGVKEELIKRYNYNFNVPLGVEIKVGYNWYKMKDIAKIDEVKLKRD